MPFPQLNGEVALATWHIWAEKRADLVWTDSLPDHKYLRKQSSVCFSGGEDRGQKGNNKEWDNLCNRGCRWREGPKRDWGRTPWLKVRSPGVPVRAEAGHASKGGPLDSHYPKWETLSFSTAISRADVNIMPTYKTLQRVLTLEQINIQGW